MYIIGTRQSTIVCKNFWKMYHFRYLSLISELFFPPSPISMLKITNRAGGCANGRFLQMAAVTMAGGCANLHSCLLLIFIAWFIVSAPKFEPINSLYGFHAADNESIQRILHWNVLQSKLWLPHIGINKSYYNFSGIRVGGYFTIRLSRYTNSDSTFQLTIVKISGDVSLNPGPVVTTGTRANFSNTNMNNITPLSGSSNNLLSNLINNHDQIHHANEIGLNCYLLNARSICNKLNEFQALVFGENLDIVAVTVTVSVSPIYAIVRFYLEINIQFIDVIVSMDGEAEVFFRPSNRIFSALGDVKLNLLRTEILVCELLPSNSRKLTICECHRPPDFSNFNTAFDLLLVNLYKDGSDRSRLYFLGDFNYPNINWQTNTTIEESGMETDFCQLIDSYFLSQLVDEPTRYDINRASILDLLLCNFPDDVSGLSITQDILHSDHLGISFRILTKVCRLRQVKRESMILKTLILME